MNTINLQDFSEGAAYQVRVVLENISRLGDKVEVWDGDSLLGIVEAGEPTANDQNEDLEKPSLEKVLEEHQRNIEQYEAH